MLNIIANIIEEEIVEQNLIFPFISDLDRRERAVLKLRKEKKSLEDIGGKFGLTRERIRQIEEKANSKVDYHNQIVRNLAKKLSEYLFLEGDIEQAFNKYEKKLPQVERKIEWIKFSKLLWEKKGKYGNCKSKYK